jgi:hypothetical protein
MLHKYAHKQVPCTACHVLFCVLFFLYRSLCIPYWNYWNVCAEALGKDGAALEELDIGCNALACAGMVALAQVFSRLHMPRLYIWKCRLFVHTHSFDYRTRLYRDMRWGCCIGLWYAGAWIHARQGVYLNLACGWTYTCSRVKAHHEPVLVEAFFVYGPHVCLTKSKTWKYDMYVYIYIYIYIYI